MTRIVGSCRFLLRLLLCAAIGIVCFQSGRAVASDGPKKQELPRPQLPPPMERVVYAPVVRLKEYPSATLVLNNRGPKGNEAFLTFFDVDGTPFPEVKVGLAAAEIKHVNVAELLPPDLATKAEVGGLSIRYTGQWNEIAAQLILISEQRTGSLDEPLRPATDFKSAVQDAVWWVPADGRAAIVIGNSSELPATALVTQPDGSSDEIKLKPFETAVMKVKSKSKDGANGWAESARVESAAAPGAIRAFGYVPFPNGASRTIRFYDPAAARQQNLFATNLELINRDIQLVLKNVSDQPLTATPRFTPIEGTLTDALELAPLRLEPGQVVEVDVSSVVQRGDQLKAVSAQVINSGQNGTLIGALSSLDRITNVSYELPLRDSGPIRNAGGSYPWRLDGDFSTIVAIANVTDERASFLPIIRFSGGEYHPGIRQLKAGETAIFDLRQLRDEQVRDTHDHVIPESVGRGQFNWSMVQGGDITRLIGRSQIVSKSQGVSGSFSCPVCCPMTGPFDTTNNPYGVSVYVDGLYQFTTTGTYSDCYGYNYPGNGVEMYWSHNNSGVAWAEQISTGNSRTHGVNPGSTSDWSDYWVQMYDNDGMDCYPWGGWGYNEQPETVFSISVSLSPASVSPGGQTTVTVSTNPPVSGQSVSMSLSEVANSGGHQHTGRPLGNFGTTSGATNASGQFQTTYTASAFGGLEMISATVGGTTASASLAVAVNGLTALGAGNNYSLVGSTPSHPSRACLALLTS